MLTKIENVPFTTTADSTVDFVALSNSTLKVRIAHTMSQEVAAGFRAWPVWGLMGWHDIRQRYRRSIIGPFWITLSMGIMVGALGFLYAQFFRQPIRDYLPFIALGIIIWGFISTLILDGCIAFTASESVIRQLRAPLSIYVFRVMWRNLIVFAHNMLIYIIIMLIFGIWPGTQALLAIP